MTSHETEIASYFAKYDPATAKLGKALRARLRDRLPGLNELVYVYERQDALVLSYSPTETGAEAVCGIGVYPREVKLFVAGGARLSTSDPSRLLQGRGTAVRHVVMSSVADFDRAEIEVLIAAALRLAKVSPEEGAKGSVILKVAAQKQRAARAKKAAGPASGRGTARPRR